MPENHPIALDFATCADLSPPELIAAAAASACRKVSLLVQPYPAFGDHDLLGDTAMRRETLAAARDLGVMVDMIEAFALTPETKIESFRPAFESGAVLGASSAHCLVRDDDESRVADHLALFAALGDEHGIKPLLEFVWISTVPTLASAQGAIARSGSRSLAVEIDILHLIRSGGRVSDLLSLPPGIIGRAQINDGPLTRILEPRVEALEQRQIPGTGDFPLREFVTALPAGVTIGIEAPLRDLREQGIGAAERARRAVEATRAIVRSADS